VAEIWDREYRQLHSIPSSTRSLPSKALCIAEPLIDLGRARQVFDAGCGNGRNATHLAKQGCTVVAADLSPAALEAAKHAVLETGTQKFIKLTAIDLSKPLPYPDQRFDLCLDSYVSCHFTDQHVFRRYWQELARVTHRDGVIFSSMFANDDEYYAQWISGDAPRSIITDPVNGITKVIYREDAFKSLFDAPLTLVNFLKFEFTDIVFDRNYRRCLFIALLKHMN
jgi:SAM-dependent methyltransferase